MNKGTWEFAGIAYIHILRSFNDKKRLLRKAYNYNFDNGNLLIRSYITTPPSLYHGWSKPTKPTWSDSKHQDYQAKYIYKSAKHIYVSAKHIHISLSVT